MSRENVLQLLHQYGARNPAERELWERVTELVVEREDCAERTCLPGHLTGSAWVWSGDGTRFLLTHHKKLGRWLQLGGHADGELNPPNVARREVLEESGLRSVRLLDPDGQGVPVDVDVHRIPARAGEQEHWHHDLRYVFVADEEQTLTAQEAESHAVRWFAGADLVQVVDEQSMLRLARKAAVRWQLAHDQA